MSCEKKNKTNVSRYLGELNPINNIQNSITSQLSYFLSLVFPSLCIILCGLEDSWAKCLGMVERVEILFIISARRNTNKKK